MAEPLLSKVVDILMHAQAKIADGQCHAEATDVCLEEPQFSTRAEPYS